MKRLYTLLICLHVVFHLDAHHIMGGVMSYRYVDEFNGIAIFDITFQVMRDADGGGAKFDNPGEFGVWIKDENGEYLHFETIGNVDHNAVTTLTFAEDSLYIHGRRVKAQFTNYVFRVRLPVNGDYVIAYRRCCRVDDLKNVFDEGAISPLEPGSTYAIEITSEAIAAKNSSPVPVQFAMQFLIPPSYFERSFSHTDIDGDILSFELTAPFKGGGIEGGTTGGNERACDGIRPSPDNCPPPFDTINYHDGFTPNTPFGPTNVSLSSDDGLLKGTISQAGLYVVGVKVNEYRNGALLSETLMDFTFRVALSPEISGARGYRFYDANQNDMRDMQEPVIPNKLAVFTPGPQEILFRPDGSYSVWADTGMYQVESLDPMFQISSNPPFFMHFDSVSHLSHIDIPFTAVTPFAALDMYIWDPGFRCNTTRMFKLMIVNEGSEIQSGNVVLTLDEKIAFVSASENIQAIGQNQYLWHYASLFPFEKRNLILTLTMPDESHEGEILELHSYAVFYPDADPSETDTVLYVLREELRCAVDPNDKITHPARGGQNPTFPEERLTYTIRFQNTGNDTAFHVELRDPLSEKLDLGTLSVLDASHDYFLELRERVLSIYFQNIALPDSATNPDGSQGYFAFSLKPIKDIMDGHVILNRASIYFDENTPILTEYTTNLITHPLIPEKEPELVDSSFTFYPNPTGKSFTILYNGLQVLPSSLHVYNQIGKHVETLPVDQQVAEFGSNYPNGVYIYMLLSDKMGHLLRVGS